MGHNSHISTSTNSQPFTKFIRQIQKDFMDKYTTYLKNKKKIDEQIRKSRSPGLVTPIGNGSKIKYKDN